MIFILLLQVTIYYWITLLGLMPITILPLCTTSLLYGAGIGCPQTSMGNYCTSIYCTSDFIWRPTGIQRHTKPPPVHEVKVIFILGLTYLLSAAI